MTRSRRIALVIIGVLLMVLLVVGALGTLIYLAFRPREPVVANNSVLVLPIKGSMPDYAPEDPFASRFFGASEVSLTSVLAQLRKAKADKRINAVLLEVDSSGAGWAKADEIREAIIDFRGSGKPVYAFMEYGANKEYYIATACDRIYVAPIGDLFINGLAAEAMFYRGALDKLGIQMDFFQIGKYKNAPDQYTRKDMSEAQREVLNAVLEDFFNRFVTTIATARRKSPDDVRALIDDAPLSANQALEAGLIDGAKYRDEVEGELKTLLKYKESDKLRLAKYSDYRRVSADSSGLSRGERIAVIYGSGVINSGSSGGGSPFGGGRSIGSDTMVKALNDARDDQSVKAIVLRVDSPGGSSYASDVIWHAVESAKAKKPVVVSMGDAAASGGYYISAGANRILAGPSTITGSIGVFAGKPVLKGLYDWVGVNSEYVTRGKNAAIFRETSPFTPDERAKFEGMIKSFYYDDFLPKVAKGRGKDVEYIDSVAQGRVWTGAQAKERGLVDEFGGLTKAIQVAKDLAKIPADKPVRPVVFPAPKSFLEEIFGANSEDEDASAQTKEQTALLKAMPEDVRRVFQFAAMFDRMGRGEVMALMPFELKVE
ncbi:MAG TPA: signal peptide peptidase SppA [Pyrinomonadaceae bacterium]|jgi:protease-4|nr:signal peptide peptidase SppA [Pyrinomonadaceae bacterium]